MVTRDRMAACAAAFWQRGYRRDRGSPRGLRHAFGVATLQAGVPFNLVQRWLGHASPKTTSIYAAAVGPEEIAFAERFWRLGGDHHGGAEAHDPGN